MSLWLTAAARESFTPTSIITIFTVAPYTGSDLIQKLQQILADKDIDQTRYQIKRINGDIIELKTDCTGLVASCEDGIADGIEEFLSRNKNDKFNYTRVNIG